MLGTELPTSGILRVVQMLFTEIVWGGATCADFVYNWDDKHFIWMWYLQVYLYKKNSGWENKEWFLFYFILFYFYLAALRSFICFICFSSGLQYVVWIQGLVISGLWKIAWKYLPFTRRGWVWCQCWDSGAVADPEVTSRLPPCVMSLIPSFRPVPVNAKPIFVIPEFDTEPMTLGQATVYLTSAFMKEAYPRL